MTGSLAVVYPGKRVPRFPSREPRAAAVSVHRIDDPGGDCGGVGKARFTAGVGNSK